MLTNIYPLQVVYQALVKETRSVVTSLVGRFLPFMTCEEFLGGVPFPQKLLTAHRGLHESYSFLLSSSNFPDSLTSDLLFLPPFPQ